MPSTTLLSHVPFSQRRLENRPVPSRELPHDPLGTREHPELLQDLRMARELQQGLLLQSMPHWAGWEVAAASLPATEIGGDLYDFVPLDSVTYGIMLGDVSGHGLAAALRMAVARTLFRQVARLGYNPALTLALLNRALITELPTGMVTMVYAQANILTGEIRIANAGHTFPILIGDRVVETEVAGLPLGIDSEEQYAEITRHIAPGETLMLYTDGLTEAEDERGRMFSYPRLESLLLRHQRQRPRALLSTLLNTIKTWAGTPLCDDLTTLFIRRRLLDLGAELYKVCDDVCGTPAAAAFWNEWSHLGADPVVWLEQLPAIGRQLQTTIGRGLSRELIQQFRILLDEYCAQWVPDEP
ncbi:MAG: PP2C family protein-serine/threonine phosphatase [Herpetosiphon sp.]